MEKLKGKKCIIFAVYACIGVVTLFLRLYKLGVLPYGLFIDEAGMGYDAWSIANYGIDRYYKFYPVYFINYGGGQNALYGYILAFLIRVFDLSLSTVLIRIPAVVFGMLTWFFGTMLAKENMGQKAGIAAVLYIIAGFAFGVTLYSYAVSWIAVPLFLIFSFVYLIYIKKLKWSRIVVFGVPLALTALPLMIFYVINAFDLPEIATAYFTITKLPEFRGSEVSLSNLINNIPQLIQVYFFNDEWTYNSVETWFTVYLVSVPFSIMGIGLTAKEFWYSLKSRSTEPGSFLLFWFAAMTFMGLLVEDPNVTRMNAVYFVLIYFTVRGLKYSWNRCAAVRRGNIHFGIPSERDEDGFYIVTAALHYISSLEEEGFTAYDAGNGVTVLYK